MHMSKRINKTKHTVRPVNKPAGKKTRFDKPAKIHRQQKQTRNTFNDLTQLKDKMEEIEMRMGGTSVNAAKIVKEVTGPSVAPQPDTGIVKDIPSPTDTLKPEIDDVDTTLFERDDNSDTQEPEKEVVISRKVGLFGALCLGVRDTLLGQVITAVAGR